MRMHHGSGSDAGTSQQRRSPQLGASGRVQGTWRVAAASPGESACKGKVAVGSGCGGRRTRTRQFIGSSYDTFIDDMGMRARDAPWALSLMTRCRFGCGAGAGAVSVQARTLPATCGYPMTGLEGSDAVGPTLHLNPVTECMVSRGAQKGIDTDGLAPQRCAHPPHAAGLCHAAHTRRERGRKRGEPVCLLGWPFPASWPHDGSSPLPTPGWRRASCCGRAPLWWHLCCAPAGWRPLGTPPA